jgi:hypothetical protein
MTGNETLHLLCLAPERYAWPDVDSLASEIGLSEGWLLLDGLVPETRLAEIRIYFSRVSRRSPCDLLRISLQEPLPSPGYLEGCDAPFAGYDVGYYDGAYAHYSLLSSEVMSGRYEVLARYETALNRYGLLPTKDLANEVVRQASDLRRQGYNLEVGEFVPIAINLISTE